MAAPRPNEIPHESPCNDVILTGAAIATNSRFFTKCYSSFGVITPPCCHTGPTPMRTREAKRNSVRNQVFVRRAWRQARRLKASIRLPPQEGRDVELIVIGRHVGRRGPAMHVKTLRRPAPGIFRDRLRSA